LNSSKILQNLENIGENIKQRKEPKLRKCKNEKKRRHKRVKSLDERQTLHLQQGKQRERKEKRIT